MIAEGAAAGSAASWGASDFCGGKASQQADARAVVVMSQLASLPLLAIGLVVTARRGPTVSGLGWAFAAGLVGAVGLILLYRALAVGMMTAVAPITAVTAGVVPLCAGLVLDRFPAPLPLVGAGCAVVAIGLVSVRPGGGRVRVSAPVVGMSLLAGSAFGLFFILLDRIPGDAGLWPLVGIRAASLAVAGALARLGGASLRLTGQPLRWAVAGGAFDIAANGLYVVATYTGLLSVVAPIASLYPASTVALALIVDRERVGVVQAAGLGLAAAALVLVSLG